MTNKHKAYIPSTGTIILHPVTGVKNERLRKPEQSLEEACGLALAIKLQVLDSMLVPLKTISPATFMGSGKVEELKHMIKAMDVGIVVFDGTLSPSQQRNLEREWKCKVIDRTALILEIFGERARTREGKLQVDLASLEYQKSRLVRSWTHLERQRGGGGFMGGPGETQIESDRREIQEKITRLKKDLEKVKRTRLLHRQSRQEVPYPVITLVGYTNAGKSTLFNQLAGENVMAEDMLFATLDPTMRLIKLPSKRKVILSDTVGFISELPTQLVAAFRATLEEVLAADIILHVRDIASEDSEAQKHDVLKVLAEMGLEERLDEDVIEVWNKIDLLPGKPPRHRKNSASISALTGMGKNKLMEMLDKHLSKQHVPFKITLDAGEGKLIAWLHEHGGNVKTSSQNDKVTLKLTLAKKDKERFKKLLQEN